MSLFVSLFENSDHRTKCKGKISVPYSGHNKSLTWEEKHCTMDAEEGSDFCFIHKAEKDNTHEWTIELAKKINMEENK